MLKIGDKVRFDNGEILPTYGVLLSIQGELAKVGVPQT